MVGTAHHDGDVSPEEIALLSRTIKSFEIDSERGAGHYLQEERPSAVVSAVAQLAGRAGRGQ
jgi:pimeloyl-ACP methyl ester carboxylesterase